MASTIIIGGGFSALIARIFLGHANCRVISCQNPEYLSKKNFHRRRILEVNKFFLPKAISIGKLKVRFNKTRLHDRLGHGGNSAIWGGVVDCANFSNIILNKLSKNGIVFKYLSFTSTGTISNSQTLMQMQNKSNLIFNASDILRNGDNYYVDSFYLKGKKIGLNLFSLSKGSKKNVVQIYTDRLVICTGIVQTIDLLYRSGFIPDKTTIQLSEYITKSRVKLTVSPSRFNKEVNSVIIRYDFVRAAGHFFGIQERKWISNIFRYFPFYIDQIFYDKIIKRKLKINDGTLSDSLSRRNNNHIFGKSIHYCDLKINRKNINTFLHNLSPNIQGLGMAFIAQKKAGPISNDIIIDAKEKLIN